MSSHPFKKPANDDVPVRINACVRSGRVDANTIVAGPPSLIPKRTAFLKPTASMTASISAARSSSVRTCGTGSDSPTPALSNTTTRQNVDSRSMKASNSGMVKQLDVADERPGVHKLDGRTTFLARHRE